MSGMEFFVILHICRKIARHHQWPCLHATQKKGTQGSAVHLRVEISREQQLMQETLQLTTVFKSRRF